MQNKCFVWFFTHLPAPDCWLTEKELSQSHKVQLLCTNETQVLAIVNFASNYWVVLSQYSSFQMLELQLEYSNWELNNRNGSILIKEFGPHWNLTDSFLGRHFRRKEKQRAALAWCCSWQEVKICESVVTLQNRTPTLGVFMQPILPLASQCQYGLTPLWHSYWRVSDALIKDVTIIFPSTFLHPVGYPVNSTTCTLQPVFACRCLLRSGLVGVISSFTGPWKTFISTSPLPAH